MNILIIGSGGREHAIGWKISQSKKTDKLFFAPGNAGTSSLGTNLDIDVNDYNTVKQTALEHRVDLIVVGPEIPLIEGIHDSFSEDKTVQHIKIIGPKKAGAQLEGSTDFAKSFMLRHNIPTAKHLSVTNNNFSEGI